MDVLEAIKTTRAMRRLDPERPVTDGQLKILIDAATRGPAGGGNERARFIVIRAPQVKQRLGEIYRRAAEVALAHYEEAARTDEQAARMLKSAWHLADHLGESPALVLVTARGRRGTVEASVYPGVQNLMLAARALGLGTTLTTIHQQYEEEVKQLLGIPEQELTFCLVPVGYPLGRWAEARRKPVTEVAYWDRWGNPPPG
ncbi:MAG TPA: nitroreductase family protein [Candidatus Dormibacteraeota bacterium]|nr:nitroreductase family protein [Candidatus Dormibacteraeota bacterium]